MYFIQADNNNWSSTLLLYANVEVNIFWVFLFQFQSFHLNVKNSFQKKFILLILSVISTLVIAFQLCMKETFLSKTRIMCIQTGRQQQFWLCMYFNKSTSSEDQCIGPCVILLYQHLNNVFLVPSFPSFHDISVHLYYFNVKL